MAARRRRILLGLAALLGVAAAVSLVLAVAAAVRDPAPEEVAAARQDPSHGAAPSDGPSAARTAAATAGPVAGPSAAPSAGRSAAPSGPRVTRVPGPAASVTADRRQADVPAAEPVRVRIPDIAVDAPVGPLGLDDGGELSTPTDPARTGWWRDGPEPGEPGPAVVVGHVDSAEGPAVFYRLRELASGDRVLVERADGSVAQFRVTRTVQAAKDDFPTEEVYGPTAGAELRLITCGGAFDRGADSYVDNLVVFAEAVG